VNCKIVAFFIAFLSARTLYFAQFYTELLSVQHQQISDGEYALNGLSNTSVNMLAPVLRENGNVFLIRGSFERLQFQLDALSDEVWSLSIPMGYQWTSRKRPSLKWTALVIPKWAAGHHRTFDQGDAWQYGLYSLATWTQRPELKFKLGLYVNQEFFGTFVVPLVGMDWKVSDRLQIFGTLPNNMKVMYQIRPNKLQAAFVFKSLTRSFRVDHPDFYLRFNEVETKALIEFMVGRSVFQMEGGYVLGQYPRLFGEENDLLREPYNQGLKPRWVVNLGYAFRISQ
jgi:hypothetical protein